MGRCLELKPAAAYCERAPVHPNLSACWGEGAPCWFFLFRLVGVGFGERPFPTVPALSYQLPGFLGWRWDTAVFPSKPRPSHRSLSRRRGGFSLPGILAKRAKSTFLVPCFTHLAAPLPSRSPEAVSSLPCLLPRSTAGIASGWLVSEVSQCFPFGPKMCGGYLAIKTWI